jgi:CubicO group peptidase (beta-lactamase class C family)
MHQTLSGYVEPKDLAGLVALVSRQDDLHAEALGTLAFGHPASMKRDTIFRVASITKPVTAAAAIILVEECKLRLDDSIDPWPPELANRRVLKSISSQLDDYLLSNTTSGSPLLLSPHVQKKFLPLLAT